MTNHTAGSHYIVHHLPATKAELMQLGQAHLVTPHEIEGGIADAVRLGFARWEGAILRST